MTLDVSVRTACDFRCRTDAPRCRGMTHKRTSYDTNPGCQRCTAVFFNDTELQYCAILPGRSSRIRGVQICFLWLRAREHPVLTELFLQYKAASSATTVPALLYCADVLESRNCSLEQIESLSSSRNRISMGITVLVGLPLRGRMLLRFSISKPLLLPNLSPLLDSF